MLNSRCSNAAAGRVDPSAWLKCPGKGRARLGAARPAGAGLQRARGGGSRVSEHAAADALQKACVLRLSVSEICISHGTEQQGYLSLRKNKKDV